MYHPITDYVLNSGMSQETFLMLTSIPIVLSIANILKYGLGIKMTNLESTLLMIYLYYLPVVGNTSNSVLSIVIMRLLVIVIIFASDLLIYRALAKSELHLYTKVAVVLCTNIIALICALFVNRILFIKLDMSSFTPHTFLLIILLANEVLKHLFKNGSKSTLRIYAKMLILCLIIAFFLQAEIVTNTLLYHPWIILLALPINFMIGRYTGLRVSEIIRFWDLLNKNEHTENPRE